MAPPEIDEKRPTTLYGNLEECPICLGPIKNPAETPCGHVACYEHLKAWGKPLVEGGQAKAGCPVCNQLFKTFWHTNGRPYTLYKKGCGAKGKLKNPRRVRIRRRGKKRSTAGDAKIEAMDFDYRLLLCILSVSFAIFWHFY